MPQDLTYCPARAVKAVRRPGDNTGECKRLFLQIVKGTIAVVTSVIIGTALVAWHTRGVGWYSPASLLLLSLVGEERRRLRRGAPAV